MYLQYTNPAAYPPLQHSSRMLAKQGWQVLFLGSGSYGADALEFPSHPNIRVKRFRYCPAGWQQKVHYLGFSLWTLLWTLWWRPRWIYASDLFSCPIALLLSFVPRLLVLYHEHDSPDVVKVPMTGFQKFLLLARAKLGQRANLCILPNEPRAQQFRLQTRASGPVFCVWNCPALEELEIDSRTEIRDKFVVFFHGSIVPARLPEAVVEALATLPNKIILRIAGYETIGHIGYVQALQKRADTLGVRDRFEFIGSFSRDSLLKQCRHADVGIAFMPPHSDDVNEQAMTGASNKPFDYLACGLALLVADRPDWKKMFVEPGYGLACDPTDPESIARTLRWFFEHAEETRQMGTNGQERVLREWNYEQQFKLPLLFSQKILSNCSEGFSDRKRMARI
jgi:glycosyltransferase involved in cell wall biosynthesis